MKKTAVRLSTIKKTQKIKKKGVIIMKEDFIQESVSSLQSRLSSSTEILMKQNVQNRKDVES